MRRSKLMVALAASIPKAQVAAKRRDIAEAAGMNEEDVVVIDGATGVMLLTAEPEQDPDLVDTIRTLLVANRSRLARGLVDEVATDMAWVIQRGA